MAQTHADLPFATGDEGVTILAVRKDTAAALAGTTGDYAPLQVDATGRLWVALPSGGAGDVGQTDDGAPTAGKLVQIAALADETSPDSVDEGDVGGLRMTLARLLRVTDSREAGATAAHRTITALDGKYPPLNSDAAWAANPGNRSKARFYCNLRVRGTTALLDDPILTMRPYVRNGGASGYVAAGETVSYTRPRLQDLSTIKLQKTTDDGANYTDYSANVIDNGAGVATLSSLDTVANGDWIVVGGPVPFMGAAMDMSTNVNANAATLTAEYWNGSAWTALTNVTDGTASGGATFGADGQITWTMPADWASSTINAIAAYWVRLSVSAALDASTEITECDLLMPLCCGIDVQADGDDVFLMLQTQDAAVTGTVAYSGTIRVSWR